MDESRSASVGALPNANRKARSKSATEVDDAVGGDGPEGNLALDCVGGELHALRIAESPPD